jgi:hypothetical protein
VADYLDEYPTLVGAYFDPATKGVVVRGEAGTPVNPDLQLALAHELTHALDYQTFDLSNRVYPDPATEQQFGLEVLKEGDAQRIEGLWADAHSLVLGDGGGQYGDVIATRFAATYELGEALVDDIVARGGQAQLNRDFDDPPMTSEQIMHPEKYAVREAPVPLDEPVADGDAIWRGVTGEYTTGQMLASENPPDVASRAAAGWGNDKGVMWVQRPDEGGLTCLRIAYVMDTPADVAELEDAFARWVEAGPDRTAFREADTIVVTSCAPVPPPPSLVSPI